MDLFADLGALTERVTLPNGASFVVRGLTLADLTQLQVRFPTATTPTKADDVAGVLKALADNARIIGPMIAAGLGHLGDEKVESDCGNLPAWVQAPLLTAIQRLSAPSKIPFDEGETTAKNSNAKGGSSATARSSSSRRRRSS